MRPARPDEAAPDVEALGDRIADLAARIQAATYELLVLIRQFDERDGWEGFASCAHWLSWRIGLAPGAAREKVRVAHALAKLPRLSEALQRGEVSYSKVRAVTRVATPATEQALLDVALAGTAAHVEQVVRTWRRVDRAAEQAEDRRRHESRALHTWVDDDGMIVVRGRLAPEVGAVLRRALEAALDAGAGTAEPAAGVDRESATAGDGAAVHAAAPDAMVSAVAAPDVAAGEVADEMPPTIAQRRADALGMVAECALAGGLDRGTAGDRYQVVVHVDAGTLADDGEPGEDPAADARPGDAAVVDGAAVDRAAAGRPGESSAVVGGGAGLGPETPALYVPAGTYRRRAGEVSPASDEASPALPNGRSRSVPDVDGLPRRRRAAGAGPAGGQSALDEAGGIHVSAETARRLACDAATVTMRHGPAGEVLDVGRRTRTISPALRRALAARDRHCRFPGCQTRRTDAHHVEHWAQGGATALGNLVLLCPRHHRAVHEEGFRVALDTAGEARFLRPDGRPLPEAPALPAAGDAPLAPVTARLDRAGIRIGPHTATPAWHGERLDVDWAVSVLWRPRGDSAGKVLPDGAVRRRRLHVALWTLHRRSGSCAVGDGPHSLRICATVPNVRPPTGISALRVQMRGRRRGKEETLQRNYVIKATTTRPTYRCNHDFVTDFKTEQGPGFFPGADGYFHGCAAGRCRPRIVFFGTDFGTLSDWETKVRGKGGEKCSQPTLRHLRKLIDDIASDTGIAELACWCHLTNAVLALAKVERNTDTYKVYRKPEHRQYLRQCGRSHFEWLQEQKPGLAVLLGARHFSVYGCGVWSTVWPDLFGPNGKWCGMEMKDALSEPVAKTESGPRVLVMYHPSSGPHWRRHMEQNREVLRQEVTRLATSGA